MTLAEKILDFNRSLAINTSLPPGVEVLNPYQDKITFSTCKLFYQKYYSDHNPRTLILGINPGRFGGGITGVPFTDPIKLEKYCGIANGLPKKPELSADFIYRVVAACGGPEKFYSRFFIGAVCPLGFVKDGKNLNYYDIKALREGLTGFMADSMRRQLDLGLNTDVGYCLGEGQNFKFLVRLNAAHGFFKEVVPLSHPRFIMQYRRKKIDAFVADYMQKLGG